MQTILITGGTGLIGKQLTQLLISKGYHVIIATRKMPANTLSIANCSYALWNIANQTIDTEAIAQADAIIHLAGAGVADERWTIARKQEILNSRVKSSQLLVKALQQTPNKVKVVVSASAIGWYGADSLESLRNGFTENAPADAAFLGETCRQWEASIEPVTTLGIRLVKLRTGIVLTAHGGALKEFLKPLQFGLATILGSGNQIVSWLHVVDMCRMYLHAIENTDMRGAYNAVAPNPVTNKALTLALATIKRGRFYIPIHVPAWVLKLVLGEMSIEVLKSANVCNDKIKASGFSYHYPSIDTALKNLCG